MGVRIHCILERDIAGIPWMEGKSLAVAYCGDAAGELADENAESADIIPVDFGGAKRENSPPVDTPDGESLLAPLDPFIATEPEEEWHEAQAGLEAVRGILEKLRAGATVTLASDFDFWEGDAAELTEAVRDDLEELEEILTAAQKEQVRFCLRFEA